MTLHALSKFTCILMIGNIICAYGFPPYVLFMCPACIIVPMHDHPFLSLNGLYADLCVCGVQVKWGLGSGCGCPPSAQVTCFTGKHSLIFPLFGAIREEIGPPAIWPSPLTLPRLPLSPQHLVITLVPPLPLCVFSVNNQAVALSVPGPNWAQCWQWLWWMEGGWNHGLCWRFFYLPAAACCTRRGWGGWKGRVLSLNSKPVKIVIV